MKRDEVISVRFWPNHIILATINALDFILSAVKFLFTEHDALA